MKDRKQKTIALVAMIVAVVGLSVGFAAFSNNLLIKSRVSVSPDSNKFGVVFSTSSTSEVTNAVTPTKNPTSITATNGTIDNSTTPTISNLSATFTSPGQSATYSFYAYNKGEYLAYLNSITFLGEKVCTAGTGTSQTLVDAACNNISVTVQIGSISTSATKTNITGETIAAGVGKPVTVTLKYEGTARADGPFSVEFGDISMYFASVTGMNEEIEEETDEESGNYIYRNSTEILYIGDYINTENRWCAVVSGEYNSCIDNDYASITFSSKTECETSIEEVINSGELDSTLQDLLERSTCEQGTLSYETNLANISTNSYLKHEVVNNQVTASYACITYTENGTRKDVCLRGGDPSYNESNLEILRSVESSGYCDFRDSNSICISDSITLDADSDWDVHVRVGSLTCSVFSVGNSYCH